MASYIVLLKNDCIIIVFVYLKRSKQFTKRNRQIVMRSLHLHSKLFKQITLGERDFNVFHVTRTLFLASMSPIR